MYRGRGRGKKALQTTLGTALAAASNSTDTTKQTDLSSLRKPIETSLFGLKQVLGLFETATDEVKNYISYECELIYECRTCRSIYRSLANFILHKREYCKGRYTGCGLSRGEKNVISRPSPGSVEVSPKKPGPSADGPLKDCQKSLAAVISKLEARQKSEEICASAMEADLLEDRPNVESDKGDVMRNANVALQEIEDSLSGVFQTLIEGDDEEEEDLTKSEVMEIHSILNNDEVILGPDGKVLPQPVRTYANAASAAPQYDLICKMCRQHFSTKKTLTQHIKYKHNKTKVVYLCPEPGCKSSIFANTWSVFRHLYKVHRKTSAQVKQMRALIQSNVLRRGQVVEKVSPYAKGKEKKSAQQTMDEENIEWMDSFEADNDLQMCGGCGKRFERRAALNSHSQMCQRRLAICNSSRKPEEERRPEIPKLVIKNHKVVGSQKRKNVHTVRKTEYRSDEAAARKGDEGESVKSTSEAARKTERKVGEVRKTVDRSESVKKTDENAIGARDGNEIVKMTDESETVRKAENVEKTAVLEELVDSDSCDVPLVMDIPEERDDVIIIEDANLQNYEDDRSIYEPEMILVEKSQVVCVSDDEDQPTVTLETKAAPFMDVNERKCVPCDHLFETIDALLKHMATHFKWFHFQCNECLFKSYDHTTLQSHLLKHHAIVDFDRYTIRLTHHEIVKNSVEFQPLFEDDERKPRSAVCADPSVQKMIMEVIFGSIPALQQQRPVRNRVAPKKDDFVYEDDVQNFPADKPVKTYSKKRRLLEEYKR